MGGGRSARASDIEQEVHHVAVLHHVGATFAAKLAGLADGLLGAVLRSSSNQPPAMRLLISPAIADHEIRKKSIERIETAQWLRTPYRARIAM